MKTSDASARCERLMSAFEYASTLRRDGDPGWDLCIRIARGEKDAVDQVRAYHAIRMAVREAKGAVQVTAPDSLPPSLSEVVQTLAAALGLPMDDPRLRVASFDVIKLFHERATTTPVWRHLKSGNDYRELRRFPLKKATTTPLVEGDILVLYEDAKCDLHARSKKEFEDGRFERVKT